MGNEISKVDLKKDVVVANNRAMGRNADGTKLSYGLADTTFEKGAYAFGVAMPIWTYKGKIANAWQNRSWSNFGAAYKQGFKNAGQTLRHPLNYFDVEFVNSKVSKLEGIINSKTPQLPRDFRFNNPRVERLYNQLLQARNPREYSEIIRRADEFERQFGRGRSRTSVYKQLCRALQKHPNELAKLKNLPQYRQIYGDVLRDFKAAQGNIRNANIGQLHQRFANASLAENQLVRTAKSGAGVMTKTGARITSGVKKAMAASKILRTASRGVGKAGGWLLAGMSALTAGLDIYSAVAASPKGEGLTNGLKQAGKSAVRLGCEVGAMAVGQWAGAAIGQVLIPIPGVGAAIGGFLGSMLGGWVGSKIADKIPYTQKTVAEELQEQQAEEQNKLVAEAIENDDIETVNNYTAQFKVPVVDEQGNQVTDDAGNPQYQIAQVSDDEKVQKEFEERVANLDNYVMTEVAKREEAEELKKQVEEAEKLRQQQMNFGGSLAYGNSYAPSGYGPSDSSETVSGFGVNGNGSFGSYTTDWRNPAWQNNLANLYNRNNIYSFNPNNYTPLWATNGKNFYAPAA